MDIYILRNGQQTGPYNDEAVQNLLKSGDTTLDDFAWRDGLPTWQPLHAVLYPKSATQKILPSPPADAPTPTPEPFMSPVVTAEPATARQKACLTFLGIAFTGDLTKERATLLLQAAAEDPKHASRVTRWDTEKLRLHPDLYAEEIKARKESRSQHFLEICLAEGAQYFHDVTKAHTQVLVGYLDVQHPHWDEHPDASRYFFAALAEKFPQLLKSGAKAQLKLPDGPKVASEMERSGVAVRSRARRSPLAAAMRGIGIGLLLLAALYGASTFYERHVAALVDPSAAGPQLPDVPLPTPPIEVAKEETPSGGEPAPTKPAKKKNREVAQTAEPTPAPEAAPAAPAAQAPVVMLDPATPAPAPAPAAGEAPPAVPLAATATPTPAPAAIPPLIDLAPVAVPATPAPRTSVKITKPTQVTLRFGSSILAAGTVVPLVNVDGVNAMVRFGPDVIPIPLANTDFTAAPLAQ